MNTATREGKDALANIAFFGDESAFSIGYRAVKTRQVGGVRELLDVELYEVSPVLFGAHPDARLYSGRKSAESALEFKAVPTGGRVVALQEVSGMARAAILSICPPDGGWSSTQCRTQVRPFTI